MIYHQAVAYRGSTRWGGGGGTEWKSAKCEGASDFLFLRSKSSDLVHAVMKFLTLYLIRIWIKIITYSTTHTETGSA